jgi:tetratricopeptide (TPR) repeat protein
MFKKVFIALSIVAMLSSAAFAQKKFSGKGFGNMSGEDSITFYEQALKEKPIDYVALTALGSLYANVRGDYDKSIEFFEKAIEINDQYDLAHLGLGMDYASLGMIEEARLEFQAAMTVTKRQYVMDAAHEALISLQQE